jgi:DNA polymerase-1
VIEKYGLPPHRLPELWALSGDVSDGVPGIPGIGPKTALKLLDRYGTLTAVAWSDDKKIVEHRDLIHTMLALVSLDGNVARCSFELTTLRFEPVTPGEKGREFAKYLSRFDLERLADRWRRGLLWRRPADYQRLSDRLPRKP